MSWLDEVDWDAIQAEDAKNQVEGYTGADRAAIRRWNPENDSNFAMDTARDLARGAIGLVDAGVGLADSIYNAATGDSFRPAAREFGWTPDEWDREIALRNSFARQDADAAVQDAEGLEAVGAYLANPRALGGALAQQVPLLAGTIGGAAKAVKLAQGASRLSPRAAAIAGASITEGALSGGSVGAAVGDHYAETGEDPGRKIGLSGLTSGAITGLIGAATGPIGGAVEAAVGSRIAGRGFVNALGKTPIRRGLRSAFGEGLEETLQSGQEQVWQNVGSGDPWSTDVGTQMAVGGLLGGIMGGALHPFTGESARSQKNLMPGANATGEEQRTAQNTVETERKLLEQSRQLELARGMAGRPTEAIPTTFEDYQARTPVGISSRSYSAQGGAVPVARRVDSVRPYDDVQIDIPQPAAVNVSAGFQGERPVNVQNPNDLHMVAYSNLPDYEVPLVDDRVQAAPQTLNNVVRSLGFTYDGATSEFNKRIKGGERGAKETINEAYNSLNPAQKTFVAASVAARKCVGDLNERNLSSVVSTAINAARENITNEQDLQAYADELANQTTTDAKQAGYYTEIGNAIGSRPKDTRFAGMPVDERIKAVASGLNVPVQAAADQTLTQQPQPEQTPPQQEAVPASPVAIQQAEAMPSQAQKRATKVKKVKAIPDSVEEMQAAQPTEQVQKAETKKQESVKPDAKTEAKTETKPAEKATKPKSKKTIARKRMNKAAEDFMAKLANTSDEDFLLAAPAKTEATSETTTEAAADKEVPKRDMFAPVPKERSFRTTDYAYNKHYRKIEYVGSSLVGTAKNINEGDTLSGNAAKKMVADYLNGDSDRSLDDIIRDLYNGLTLESMDMVLRHVYNFAAKQGGEQYANIRWFYNALDSAVNQKAEGRETVEIPVPSQKERNAYEANKRFSNMGLVSLFEDGPVELNYEYFMQDKFDTPSVDKDLKKYKRFKGSTAAASQARLDQENKLRRTIEDLENGVLRLMVNNDNDAGWGRVSQGQSAPMLAVQRITQGGSATKTGWRVLKHKSGRLMNAAEQAEVFERLYWATIREMDNQDSSEAVQLEAIQEAMPVAGSMEDMLGKPDSSIGYRANTAELMFNSSQLQKVQEKLSNRLKESGKIDLDKVADDLKEMLPLTFRANLIGEVAGDSARAQTKEFRIEADHPFNAFITGGAGAREAILHGFTGAAMYVPLSRNSDISPTRLDLELAKASGLHKDSPVRGVSPVSERVYQDWVRTATQLGDLIGHMPISNSDREVLIDTLTDWMNNKFLPRVETKRPKINAVRDRQESKYYTTLAELRSPLIETFKNSMRGAMLRYNTLKYRWADRKGAVDNAFTKNGKGLISGATPEARDLRANFMNYVKEKFEEHFNRSAERMWTEPLEERIDFYNSIAADPYLKVMWIESGKAGKDFPNGRFVFSENASDGDRVVQDFLPSDLWIVDWVKASGVFTAEEIRNAQLIYADEREADKKKKKSKSRLSRLPNREAYETLYEALLGASNNYAQRIQYAPTFGIADDIEGQAKRAAEGQDYKTKQKRILDKVTKDYRDFYKAAGNPVAVNENWGSYINMIKDMADTSARLVVLRETYDPNTSGTNATEAQQEEFDIMERRLMRQMDEYTNNINSTGLNMLISSDTLKGDARNKAIEAMRNGWMAVGRAHYMLNHKQVQLEFLKEFEQARAAERSQEAKLQIARNFAEYQSADEYISEEMGDLDMQNIDDIINDGSADHKKAVALAQVVAEDVMRWVSFMQARGEVQIDPIAQDEVRRELINAFETGRMPEDIDMFSDVLGAYLKAMHTGESLDMAARLNEQAAKLYAQRGHEVLQSGYDPDALPEVQAAKEKWQEAKAAKDAETQAWLDNGGHRADLDLTATMRSIDKVERAYQKYLDAYEKGLADEVMRRHGVADTVFGRQQYLSATNAANIHEGVTNQLRNLKELIQDQKKRVGNAEDEAAIRELWATVADTWDDARVREFSEKLRSQTVRKSFREWQQDSKTHPQNKRLLNEIEKTLAGIMGAAEAGHTVSEVEIGFFDESDIAGGMFTYIDGKPVIFLHNIPTKDFAYSTMSGVHEFVHYKLGALRKRGGVHALPAMRMAIDADNRVYPVGFAAAELKDLCMKHTDLDKQLADYPLSLVGKISLPRIKMELLAETGTLWMQDPKWREIFKREAPVLAKIFTDYLGDGTNGGPTKRIGRPVGRLGEQNAGAEATRNQSSSVEDAESAVFQYRPRQSNNEVAGSSQSTEPSSGTRDRNAQQEVASGPRPELLSSTEGVRQGSGNGQAGGPRVRPLVAAVQRVINKFPERMRPMLRYASRIAEGWYDDYVVNGFLGMLFTNDLARLVEKEMPSIKDWIAAKQAQVADINTDLFKLQDFDQRYEALPQAEKDQLNKMLSDTTYHEIWLERMPWMSDKEWADNTKSDYAKKMQAALLTQLQKLPSQAKRLYNEILTAGHDANMQTLDLMQKEAKRIYDELALEAKDEAELKELKAQYENVLKIARLRMKKYHKPYVPMLRHGSHVVVAMSDKLRKLEEKRAELRAKHVLDEDEYKELLKVNEEIDAAKQNADDYVVLFVDGQAKANVLADDLMAKFKGRVETFPREEIRRHEQLSFGAINKLEDELIKRLGDKPDEEGRKMINRMVTLLSELHTLSLADASAAHNQLRRLKVHGWDADMVKNFLDNGRKQAYFINNIKHQGAVQHALRNMRDEATKTSDDVPRHMRMRVLNEVNKREDLNFRYRPNEAVDRIQRLTSSMMLLTSPAFYLQNMTQSFMMSAPYMTKEFDGTKVFNTLSSMTKEVIKAYFDKGARKGVTVDLSNAKWMTPGLASAIEVGRQRGLIDIGISQDMGELHTHGTFKTVTDFLAKGARAVEFVNRVSTFATAYNLMLEKHKDAANVQDLATEYACDVVRETHGDYSAINEPRFFQRGGLGLGGAEKLIFQFRKFQLIQIGYMVRLAKDAFKNADPQTRAAARRALAWTMGTHFTMTGLVGTPFVTTLAFILNGIFGDDDDSTEDTLRDFIGDKDMSNLLIKGLPAYLGVDVSERIGAANMFSPFPYLNATPLSGREGANETLVAMMGPFASQFVRMSGGAASIMEGDLYKGIEQLLPNGLTNAMRAFRYATEGYTTKNGTVTIPPEEYGAMETFFQALGLPTTVTTDRYRLQEKLMNTQERRQREESRLNKAYRDAETAAERRAVMREYVKLQKKYEEMGFKPKNITQLVKNDQKVKKDAKNAIGGLVVNNSNKAFVQYWSTL